MADLERLRYRSMGPLWGLIEQARKVVKLYGCSDGNPGISKNDLYEKDGRTLKPESKRLEAMYQTLFKREQLFVADLEPRTPWGNFMRYSSATDAIHQMMNKFPRVARLVRGKLDSRQGRMTTVTEKPANLREYASKGKATVGGEINNRYLGTVHYPLRRAISERNFKKLKETIIRIFREYGVSFSKDDISVEQYSPKHGSQLLIIFEPPSCKPKAKAPSKK